MIYISCDNGVSGSFAWVNEDCSASGVMTTPTFVEQDYTIKKQNVTRVDFKRVFAWFNENHLNGSSARIIMERPFVNPMMFRATLSAIRAWEATLIAICDLQLPRIIIDSKKWQKAMLPTGCEGSELKIASVQVGKRLFPDHSDWIDDQGDADALLLAEYARRNKL